MELLPFDTRHARLIASWMPDHQALGLVALSEHGTIGPDLIFDWADQAHYPFMLVTESGEEPVAYGELMVPSDVPGIWAQHVIVDPRHRGQGHGWTLIEQLGANAHLAHGHERLWMTLRAENDTARALVGAMGFALHNTRQWRDPDSGQMISVVDCAGPLPLRAYAHREIVIPPGATDKPGFARGLRRDLS